MKCHDCDLDPGNEEMWEISGPQKVTCPYYLQQYIVLSFNSSSMQQN